MRAQPIAWNVLSHPPPLQYVPSRPIQLHLFQILCVYFLELGMTDTGSLVDPRNETGHPSLSRTRYASSRSGSL